jgi:hypothetical protein
MLEGTESRVGLKPEFMASNSACGPANTLAWLVKAKKIAPHILFFNKAKRSSTDCLRMRGRQ